MTLTQIEHEWVAYARRLLADGAHQRRCELVGGSPVGELDPQRRLDADLRWPGYLGCDYRAGGVLCVATVHRDFETNGAGPAVRADIVDATRGLRSGTLDASAYLQFVRRGYESGLASWVVGGHLGLTLKALDVPLTAIAYVDAARCQVPEDWSHLSDKAERVAAKATCSAIKAAVLRTCWADYPITDLIEMLRPTFVLFANAPTFDRAAGSNELGPVAAACIHAWQGAAGTLLRPLDVDETTFQAKTPLGVWAPRVRALLANYQQD